MILHDTITSAANPRVRDVARLRDADARRATGLTLIDGRRELARAARAGIAIEQVFVAVDATGAPLHGTAPVDRTIAADLPSLADLAAHGTRITGVSGRAFERIAFGSRNEGVVGVARYRTGTLDRFDVAHDRPVFILEGLEKPGNLGAILRTADAAGLAGVILCDGRTDAANPAVIRASLGTVFAVPLAAATVTDTIAWCRARGRSIVAAMPEGMRLWHEARLSGTIALLLGSESHGISPAWGHAGNAGGLVFGSVRLPMHGVADSLNVSATAAVLAYESLRQRERGFGHE